MNILSLFAGIGGLELGLERAGLGTTRWQVELEPFNRKVLAAHWPDAERFADVRDVSADDFPGCDVICGGFPCQDISSAGKGEGIDGQRSGLWREFARLIGEIRP
ncbi:MAG: DNA cytosine methyltransferase, partial [Actinomycetales bacterium]|nr:DNA cytosine methyltransferase [Actinomycetales bacterium]